MKKLQIGEHWSRIYILDGLDESDVWLEDIKPLLDHLPQNVLDIWSYGFTEMLNNAIEHSGGMGVEVRVRNDGDGFSIIIIDNGEGLFRKIARELKINAQDTNWLKLELAKGKLTTNKESHSGEGIFFASKAFDMFLIRANGFAFTNGGNPTDDSTDEVHITSAPSPYPNQTSVFLFLKNSSTQNMKRIFDQYTSEIDGLYAFDKTIVPVALAQQGDNILISRSQAKRVLARLDQFRHVTFDFAGVEEIGQAFGDEIFRVFKNFHPDIELEYINAVEAVQKMIRRAQSHRS